MRQKKIKGTAVMSVVGVDIGVERSGVDQDRYWVTSTARSSSIRSEMSSRPLRPAPAARSWRFRPPR